MTTEKSDRAQATRWALWGFGLLALLIVGLSALNALGFIGQTVLEREVFEQSYQRTAGLESKMATMNAQMAEIDVLLQSDLDPSVRTDLEAQKAALNVQISSTQSQINQ